MHEEGDARGHGPVEVTTHNIYFHEDSPVLAVDGYSGVLATCGCDKAVRLWRVASAQERCRENTYRTAVDSSVTLELLEELGGFARPINCVRFHQQGAADDGTYLLAACSDAGRVIVYEGGVQTVVRREDGDDAYDMCWADDRLFVGLASGRIETYAMERGAHETRPTCAFRLDSSLHAHRGTIQGIAYNRRHGLLATHSLDRSVKVTATRGGPPRVLATIDQQIDHSRGLFKRLFFADSSLYVLASNNTVAVFAYPFRRRHLHKKIGPLNAAVVRVLEGHGLTFVCTKKSVYVLAGTELVVCVDELAFMTVTDACICGGILFVSAMDGFLASVRLGLPGCQ